MAFDYQIDYSPFGQLSETDYSYEIYYVYVDKIEYRFTFSNNVLFITNEDLYIIAKAIFTGDLCRVKYLSVSEEINEEDVVIEEDSNPYEVVSSIIAECF